MTLIEPSVGDWFLYKVKLKLQRAKADGFVEWTKQVFEQEALASIEVTLGSMSPMLREKLLSDPRFGCSVVIKNRELDYPVVGLA